MAKIGVIGAGAWGTAISNLLARNGNEVRLWAYESEVVKSINEEGENKLYLAGVSLSENIKASSDFNDLLGAKAIFIVVPAQLCAKVLVPLKEIEGFSDKIPLVICSKGIENEKLKTLNEILAEIFTNPIAAMSGPNFADEVALGKNAITTIAAEDLNIAENIASLVRNEKFTPYICQDVIGVELCGSIKNVIAIALGIANGKDYSESAKAALMTKGLNEIAILAKAMGGNKRTCLEACGVGDLILTCSSTKSRNMSLGFELGKGKSLQEILSSRKTIAEGVATTKAAYQLGQKLGVNLEVINKVYNILYEEGEVDL